MTCRPHHTACPGPEACTCEGLARPTASPDCPYVMHGHVPPPVDDISALEVLQDLSSWVGWGGLSASPTDYTAQEWGARIREGVEWHARAEAQMQKAWCTEALDWREACEDHGIAPDVDSLRAYLETMRDTLLAVDRLLACLRRDA